jgi:1-acyl-sn-glycerol-3-phosphate acyltransferase
VFIISSGSQDDKWLIKQDTVIAHGNVVEEEFHVTNSLDSAVEAGAHIALDNLHRLCIFPEGTRVKVKVIEKVQLH